MAERILKPVKLTREQIESYEFTKKQKDAYAALRRATERCEKAGLSLFGQQWNLIAIPSKFYMNQMVEAGPDGGGVQCPFLSGAALADSGGDDELKILPQFVSDY